VKTYSACVIQYIGKCLFRIKGRTVKDETQWQ